MTVFDLDAPLVTVKVKAGDKWVIPLWYKIGGTGVDVSGLDLRAQVRASSTSELLFEFEVDKDLGDPTEGQFGLVASTADTTGKHGTYYSDVEIVADDEPTTIVALTLVVSPEITR